MAIFYNTNGTISDVVINAIIDGKVTSSLATAPTIQQAFEASASNAIYQTQNPTKTNRHSGSIYPMSSTTKKQNLSYTYNNTNFSVEQSASMALYKNDPNDNTKKGYQNYWVLYRHNSDWPYTSSLDSRTVDRDRNPVSEKAAFESKYPTDKSDWTLVNGVLTSPKNR